MSATTSGGDGPVPFPGLPPPAATILKRILTGIASFAAVCLLIFLTVNALPGDVVTTVLGQNATEERISAVSEILRLDRPVLLRYAEWFSGLVAGDFGVSTAALAQEQTVRVRDVIVEPLRNSAMLAGLGLLVFIPVSLGVGIASALRAGGLFDRTVTALAVAVAAMPEFLVGTLLVVVFFTWLDWLPPVAYLSPGESIFAQPDALVLPVLTLLSTCLAFGIRLVKATVGEVLAQDYVAMARLNGYGEWHVLRRYVLRNALAPLIQGLSQVVKFMVGGVVVVESVFALPGIGTSLVGAVAARDIQETSVIAALLAGIYIAMNVAVDVVIVLIGPALRAE